KEQKGKSVLLACYSEGSAERLSHVLREHGLGALSRVKNWLEAEKNKAPVISLAVLPLEHGFTSEDLLLFTEQDILGDRLARPQRKRGASDEFSLELSQLSEGDIVVHEEHGIGRFVGLETLTAAGAPHDCLKLLYEGGDRLYVPVENLEVLSR